MGVKGLFPYLRDKSPWVFASIPYSRLRGRKVAIDGNLLLIREVTSPWLPADMPIKHKAVMWSLRLGRLARQLEIEPIVVFDSPSSSPAKARERAVRKLRQQQALNLYNQQRDEVASLRVLRDAVSNLTKLSVSEQQDVVAHLNAHRDGDTAVTPELPVELRTIAKNIAEHVPRELTAPSEDLAVEQKVILGLLEVTPDSATVSQSFDELDVFVKSRENNLRRLSRRVALPTWQDMRLAQSTLADLGIPAVVSPSGYEGECTAALLHHSGLADYVATEDSDVLLFNAPQLRGFMAVTSSRPLPNPSALDNPSDTVTDAPPPIEQYTPTRMTLVSPIKVRQALNLDESAFIDFTILAGCDFTRSIPALGIRTAHRLMLQAQEPTLEKLLDFLPSITVRSRDASPPGYSTGNGSRQRYVPHAEFWEDATIARAIYTALPPISAILRELGNGSTPALGSRSSLWHNWRNANGSEAQRQAKELDVTIKNLTCEREEAERLVQWLGKVSSDAYEARDAESQAQTITGHSSVVQLEKVHGKDPPDLNGFVYA
ncbi:hypothetical protein PYCC9005_002245 [Savitreella phatthalungensis]